MKPLEFYGCSDDTFGEYSRLNIDHDNCANGKPIVFRVAAGDEQLFVFGQFAPIKTGGGCWVVGVAPVEEDAMPQWPMRLVDGGYGYTYALQIDAPENATVTLERAR